MVFPISLLDPHGPLHGPPHGHLNGPYEADLRGLCQNKALLQGSPRSILALKCVQELSIGGCVSKKTQIYHLAYTESQ